ncbi:MAG: PaaD-like zinc ribbon domain-containing protein [Candidatus Thorarchaeota archaeon SMTZ1-83]
MTDKVKCPRCGSASIARDMYPGSAGVRSRYMYACSKCGSHWEDNA